MRILVLTFYYPPDLSAGSFRNAALVRALQERSPSASIEIITTMPQRYEAFRPVAPEHEQQGNAEISRLVLPRHHGRMSDQSRSFAAYTRHVLRMTRGQHYDVVYASSSRLMTA